MADTTMDPYRVLGVPADATKEQIRAAYRRRIRETHPDQGGDAAEAALVNQAWAQLNDPTYERPASAHDGRPTRSDMSDRVPHSDGGQPGNFRPGWSPDRSPAAPAPEAPPQPLRSWWVSPYAWVPAGAWLVILIINLFAGAPYDWPTWAAAGLYAAGTWAPVVRRGFKLPAAALISAVALEVVYITPETHTLLVLAATVTVWIGVALARRSWTQSIYRSLRYEYERACRLPDVGGWLIRAAEPGSHSTRCLLENDDTGRVTTRHLWGKFVAGDRVALEDAPDAELPIVVLPVEAQKTSRWRRK